MSTSASENGGNGNRINVSRDALRAELTQLELRIVDRITAELNKKADRSHVEALERDLEIIKVQGSPGLAGLRIQVAEQGAALSALREQWIAGKHLVEEHEEMQLEVRSLSLWRNRLVGGLLAALTLASLSAGHVWFGL